jgi:lysophospholipase L1-like esterase
MASFDTNLVGASGQSLSPDQVLVATVGSVQPVQSLRQIAACADRHDFSGTVFAALGDSISALAGITSGATQYPPTLGYRTAGVTGYASWVAALSKQRITVEPIYNRSVSGRVTADMLAAVPEVIALNPDWCFVEGGTNDIGFAYYPLSQTLANLTAIYQKLTAAGIRIIAIPVTPRTAPSGFTTAQNEQVACVNRFIRQYAKYNGNIVVADPRLTAFMNVATGNPATGMTSDGLHPNAQGAYNWGTYLWTCVQPFLQIADMAPCIYDANDVFDAVNNPTGNVLANSLFTTTSGGTLNGASLLTGNVPASWTATMTKADTTYTGTIALTNAARTDTPAVEGNWLIITAASLVGTVTGGPQDHVQLFQQVNLPAGINPGDYCEAMVEIDVNATAGFNGFDVDIGMNDGVTTWFSTGMGPASNSSAWAQGTYRVVLKTPRTLVPPTVGATQRVIQGFVNVYFDTTPATGTATAVIKIASLSVRKVT